MAWTLQPRNYMQAIRPNLYNVAYKRTGTYKGMGQTPGDFVSDGSSGTIPMTSGSCPGSPGCPGYVMPDQNLATAMESVQMTGQTTFIGSGAYNQLLNASVVPAATTSTFQKWLPLIIAGGAVAVLLLTDSGGRRR